MGRNGRDSGSGIDPAKSGEINYRLGRDEFEDACVQY